MKKMKQDTRGTQGLKPLGDRELAQVTGGAWVDEGGGSSDYAWRLPPTIPDIGWDSYFWFA